MSNVDLPNKVQVWVLAKEKVLLLKTLPERGGSWQPVTGWVEEGENLFHAATREVAEETGLSFDSAPRPLGYEFSFDGRHGPAKEACFVLEVPEAEVRFDPKEHTEFRWATHREVDASLQHESHRIAWGKVKGRFF